MNRTKLTWIFVIALASVTASVSFRPHSSLGQERVGRIDAPTPPSNEHFPVVAFGNRRNSRIGDDLRRSEKNRSRNGRGFVQANPHTETSEIERFEEGESLSFSPTKESTTIVVGEAVDSHAFLSEDLGFVYSELTFKVDRWLKRSKNETKIPMIKVDRPGGVVLYPDGRKVIYSIAGKGLPKIGNRYLLFLNYSPLTEDYSILRAYELTNGSARPIDYSSKEIVENEKELVQCLETIISGGKNAN
jgi:hypothetical protein